MQLSYRGLPYKVDHSGIETTESNVYAQHHGVSYPIRRPVNQVGVQTPVVLRFRGNSYLKF
jgi:hypothetical protein